MSDSEKQQIRNGPHPLALHVATATQNWTGAAAAFPLFQLGGMQIHPDLKQQADDLRSDLTGYDPEKLLTLIMQKAQSRLSHTLSGIKDYQHHSYERESSTVPIFHQIGTTEIRDYGTKLPDAAAVVIAVPSLVNPAYILDLQKDNSLMDFLAQQNIHPYLLDWARPGPEELDFDLEDYILKRLIPLIREVHKRHNKKIHLMGYCMGGNLSLAAAQILQSENILKSLTLIATPWDFHADQPLHLPAMTEGFLKMEPIKQDMDAVPMNIMQLFFFSLDPTLSDRKFRKFSQLDHASSKARNFVAIEDWANDGAPLSPQVTKDCLINWYQQNQPHKNHWRIGGQVIDPTRLTLPGHIITPQSDRIVPAVSAKALQEKLPRFHHTKAQGGHVTMIAGEFAQKKLWHKIALHLK